MWSESVASFGTRTTAREGRRPDESSMGARSRCAPTDTTVADAYRRSIQTLSNWLHREVNTRKTHVIYSTYAPVHFRSALCLARMLW
ncbi:unnamed protein product [Urochloa humidicola]